MAIDRFIKKKICTIRELSRIIGLLISACPAVQYGWLHTKRLEREKVLGLRKSSGNYYTKINVSAIVITELLWWKQNIKQSFSFISCTKFAYEIFTDASKTGWGAACNSEATHGFWDQEKVKHHINYLELLAVYYALKCFASNEKNCNILLRVDNKTAIAYVNKMGGIKFQKLNNLSKQIWSWCEERKIFLHASYIPSKENIVADKQSRMLNLESEYSLNKKEFLEIEKTFGKPDIDLFASKINAKCKVYISWFKDPGALTSDAFTIIWDKSLKFYAFPPFPIIGRVLKKIIEDKSEGVVVVPYWPNQSWFLLYLKLCLTKPKILKPNENLLLSPLRTSHPMWKNLPLAVSKLSGNLF